MALIVAGAYMYQRWQIRRKYGTKKGANLAPCAVVVCVLVKLFLFASLRGFLAVLRSCGTFGRLCQT